MRNRNSGNEQDASPTNDAERPWHALYAAGLAPELPAMSHASSIVEAWSARVRADPGSTVLRYFDASLDATAVDEHSNALAAALHDHGVRPGDRVAIRLQNIPQYPISMLAVWKLGATVLLMNPMYKTAEARHLLADSGAVGVIADEADVDALTAAAQGTELRWILSTSSREFQSRDDPRIFTEPRSTRRSPDGDWMDWVRAGTGQPRPPVTISPDDLALLTYTSGTTGPPKGAMNTHRNVLAVAGSYGAWTPLDAGDVVFALAPLFHITGAVINATMALLHPTTLVLAHRFHPEVVLEEFASTGVTFTIGSITAFNALAQHPAVDRAHFASVKYLYSGGAPIPPTTVERFAQRFGHYIHNVYGMTETSSAVIAVPPGAHAPVHAPSNTLSVGVPLPGLDARVIDPEGNPVPPGEQGELELSGAAVVPGYWRNPVATESTMPNGRLRTGDGAIMDEEGWVFLVDRIKDQINVSGYKVWPREVEDALYEHPAVHEAAVVGRPDAYQGESVMAFVSMKSGKSGTSDELVAFVRERLASYKCPREVVVLPELPKTETGKIRRKQLRDDVAARTR